MWNLENYEDVNARIKRFRATYPLAKINTMVVSLDAINGDVLVKCTIWKEPHCNDCNCEPDATDWAFGDRETYPKNMQKWYVEDTVTSAVGRAIALLLDVNHKATKQNMARVETIQVENPVDPWVSDPKPMPIEAKESFVDVVQGIVDSAEVIPNCDEHGKPMKLREGVKNNRAFRGYICDVYEGHPMDKTCKPKWQHISKSTGKWVFN